MKNDLNIVWMKRDLRTLDHGPLHEAKNLKITILLFIFLNQIKLITLILAKRHQHFIYRSIIDINKKLLKYRRKVYIFHAILQIFSIL